MTIDPDDPRPPKAQIAGALRAAIKSKKLTPGDKLPSQNELAERYGVSRMTIHHALQILRQEGLVVTKQGTGMYVRASVERQVGLRPHIESAFEREDVSIDFAGLSSETLRNALGEVLDKVRVERFKPKTVRLRALIVDTSQPLTLPALAETGKDDPRVRQRADRITRRSVDSLVDEVRELQEMGFVERAETEVRTHPIAPSFKLFLLNDEEVFFGFYPVVRHTVKLGDEDAGLFDVMGKDANLFYYSVTDDEASNSAQFVEQARAWWDSVWNTVAREYQP